MRRYPRAADTAEGIFDLWLPRRGIDFAPDELERVLEELVADGRLERFALPGGGILFRARRRRGRR